GADVYSDPTLLFNYPVAPVTTSVVANGANETLSVNYTGSATFKGAFVVTAKVSDPYATTTQNAVISLTNNAPTLTVQTPVTLAHTQTTASIPFSSTDADIGDSPSFAASLTTAYNLEQQYGFFQDPNGYYTGSFGANAKWLRSTTPAGGWFFIRTN